MTGVQTCALPIFSIRPSEYGDKFGGVTPKTTVTGEGSAYLLRNGTVTKVQWSRSSAESLTQWTLTDGTNAHFARGQVWLFLTDQEPSFEYPPVETKN